MEDHLVKAVVASLEHWAAICEDAAASEDPVAQILRLRSELRTARVTLLMFERCPLGGRREAQKLQLKDITL